VLCIWAVGIQDNIYDSSGDYYITDHSSITFYMDVTSGDLSLRVPRGVPLVSALDQLADASVSPRSAWKTSCPTLHFPWQSNLEKYHATLTTSVN